MFFVRKKIVSSFSIFAHQSVFLVSAKVIEIVFYGRMYAPDIQFITPFFAEFLLFLDTNRVFFYEYVFLVE